MLGFYSHVKRLQGVNSPKTLPKMRIVSAEVQYLRGPGIDFDEDA